MVEHFDSIHPEEYGSKYAGKKKPRVDFFLSFENIAIEVKCVRDKSHAKKIHEEIILDIAYYSKRKDFQHLYFFIYDPNSYLLDRTDFITDLEQEIPQNYSSMKIIIKPPLE